MKYRIIKEVDGNNNVWYYAQYHKGHWWNKWNFIMVPFPAPGAYIPLMEQTFEKCKNHLKAILDRNEYKEKSNLKKITEIYEDIF